MKIKPKLPGAVIFNFVLLLLLLAFVSIPSYGQLFATRYYSGSYTTLDSVKHTGLIGLNPDPALTIGSHPDNILYFKQDKDADKQKVHMSTLIGFVSTFKDSLGVDTFTIVHHSKSSRIRYKNDYVQVLFRKGPVNLYDYHIIRRAGYRLGFIILYVDNYYYYGTDPDSAVEMDNKDFIDVMGRMLADDPAIVEKIGKKEYKMGSMFKLLNEYYSRHSF